MLKLKKWLYKRKKTTAKQSFDSGYGWACTELLHHKKSVLEIDAALHGKQSSFDSGARSALNDISNLRQLARDLGRITGD